MFGPQQIRDLASSQLANLLRLKPALIREIKFVLVICLWVGFYVAIMRHRWTEIEERDLVRNFVESNSKSVVNFEERFKFWDFQAKRLSVFVADLTPSSLKLQNESWSSIYDAHPEWLATYVITKRQGFEPGIALTLTSKKLRAWLPQDKDTPISWSDEAQSAATQLVAGKTANQPLVMQLIRSIDKENFWVQVVFKSQKANPGWSSWVVHTFSEKILPELLEYTPEHDSIIFFPNTKKMISSREFSRHKIEASELIGLLEKNSTNDKGFSEQSFAIAKKNVWVGWKYSKNLDASLIKILANEKIPTTGNRETPSLLADWLLSLIWMTLTAIGLWISYSKNLWRLNLQELPAAQDLENQKALLSDPYSKDKHKTLTSTLLSDLDSEREFCRHLLTDVGPIGDVALSGNGRATVEVSASSRYKGSWWIIQSIDENRILVAIGDASGEGIAAGTAAYSVRHFIEVIIQRECTSRDTESFLTLVYDLCAQATEGVLLGSAHVALFAGIIEIDKQKLCFLNAGFPSPVLKLGGKKKISLFSFVDPIGLGSESHPLPHWVNLTPQSHLLLCNIGARNMDLDELDDSELIKIHVYPFESQQEDAEVSGQISSEHEAA
ncbi:MAG: SpoIIE family protein phosphatase [Silvanigrellaceae bacterium]